MRIIVVGGRGTIGAAVVKELSSRHEVLIAGRKQGDFICDMASEDSIHSMFEKAGKVDAVAVTAGDVHFEKFSEMTSKKYRIGIDHKLMGQVNIVMIGARFIQAGGSFTLISGILSVDPIKTGSSASMVNGAIESFVKSAAIEMPRQIRINVVSPTVITEAMPEYGSDFRGYEPVPACRAALAFSKSIEGAQTGQIYRVGY